MSYPPLRFHHSRRHRSQRDSQRRKAAIGIFAGLAAIVCGVTMFLLKRTISPYHIDELLPAFAIFFAGYCSVNVGCWYWVQLKGVNDAVLVVGFVPFFLLLVPFVRLIFFMAPQLIILGMIVTPLLLLSLIALLPSQR